MLVVVGPGLPLLLAEHFNVNQVGDCCILMLTSETLGTYSNLVTPSVASGDLRQPFQLGGERD